MPTIAVTDATFDRDVLKSEVPVLVDFWAPWCRPCKALAPILEEISEEWKERVIIAKVDIEQNPTMMVTYEIRSIPTLILFQDGTPTLIAKGALSRESFAGFFKQAGLT